MLEGETFYGEKREHVQNKATFSQTKWEVIRLMSSKPNKSKHWAFAVKKERLFTGVAPPRRKGS